MRCANFAIPMLLGSDPGSYPISLSQFPIAFPLADFCRIYYRVKLWKFVVRATVTINGVTELVESEQVLNRDEFTLDLQENYRVYDPVYNAEIAVDGYNRYGGAVAVDEDGIITQTWDNYLDMLSTESGASFPPFNRGYWTGSHDGEAGEVIPRLRASFLYYNAIPDVLNVSGFDFYVTSEDYHIDVGIPPRPHASGYFTGNLMGYEIDYRWFIDVNGGVSALSVTDLYASFEPHEYFDFSDGQTAVYDSSTGAQLLDPYTSGT